MYYLDYYIQVGNTFITVEFENSSSPMIFDRVFKYFTRAFNSLIKKGSPLGFVPSVKSVAFLSKNVFPSQGAHIRVNLSPNIPELNEYRIKNNISEPVELNFIQLQKLPSIYEDQSRFNLFAAVMKATRFSELKAIREIAKGDPVVVKLIDTIESSLGSRTLLQIENQIVKKYLIEIDDLKEENEAMAKENKAQLEAMARENSAMAKKIADLEARLAKAGVK